MKMVLMIIIMVTATSCSLFHASIGQGTLPDIPATPVIAPITPQVPTVVQTQVKVLRTGWYCLLAGVLLLAATLAFVPIGAKLYTGAAGVLLILLWPVSYFISEIVPYLPWIGGTILLGSLTLVIFIVWKNIKEIILSVEKLHILPNWKTEIVPTLSKEQSQTAKNIIAKITGDNKSGAQERVGIRGRVDRLLKG